MKGEGLIVSMRKGLITAIGCKKHILIDDLFETKMYSCESLKATRFFGPVTVHSGDTSVHLTGMPFCSRNVDNHNLGTEMCSEDYHAYVAPVILSLVVLFQLCLIVLLCLRSKLILYKGKKEVTEIGGKKYMRVQRKDGSIREERLGWLTMFIFGTLLCNRCLPKAEACVEPQYCHGSTCLFNLQSGDSICESGSTYRVVDVEATYPSYYSYMTHPWCLDADSYSTEESDCPSESECLSLANMGNWSSLISHWSRKMDSCGEGYIDPVELQDDLCYYQVENQWYSHWKESMHGYSRCRKGVKRIVVNHGSKYMVSRIGREVSELKVTVQGPRRCKLSMINPDQLISNPWSLVKAGDKSWVCPQADNHLRPTSNSLGDLQGKEGVSRMAFDWSSVQCNMDIRFMKCTAHGSFISNGLKSCVSLPGYIDGERLTISSKGLKGSRKNVMRSVMMSCPSLVKLDRPSHGDCLLVKSELWGLENGLSPFVITFQFRSANPDSCVRLESRCLEHTDCIPCDSAEHHFKLLDNRCDLSELNYTDKTIRSMDVENTEVDASFNYETGKVGPKPLWDGFTTPLSLGLGSFNMMLIVVIILFLRK